MNESPFTLTPGPAAGDAYARWREAKLRVAPVDVDELVVEIADPLRPSPVEIDALRTRIAAANMAVYVTNTGDDPNPSIPRAIMAALGVTRFDVNPEADDDGVTSLTPKDAADLKGLTEYIPYSASAINWHTDGYYNTAEHRIRSLALHCVRQAADGGDNDLLDHEMAYLMLRDRLHDFVTPLFAADAMTIPRREENGVVVRPDMPGPVFIDEGGALTMRYTHRTRSIRWKTDEATTKAVAMLRGLLEMITPYHFRVALEPGWGLVCNNVLHARTAFSPASDRLLYRLRYYDRVAAR